MRKLLLIFGALLLAVPVSAQTSITCSGVGVCGNQILHNNNGGSSGNNGAWNGNPVTISVGSLTVAQWAISLRDIPTTSTVHVVFALVCDNNLSGTTIASGGNCPANNVICSSASVVPLAYTNNVFPATGCGTLLTTVRYWIFVNGDNANPVYFTADAGASPKQNSWFIVAACCTVPSSLTGTVADTGAADEINAILTSIIGTGTKGGKLVMGGKAVTH